MAVDTAEKRATAIMPTLPFRPVYPVPDGSDLDSPGQRQGSAWQYSGISSGGAAATTFVSIGGFFLTTKAAYSG